MAELAMRPSVLAIVQARMSSSRLPGKALVNVGHQPLIKHVADRVSTAVSINDLVFALPKSDENRILAHYIENQIGHRVFFGSENDVLSRFASVVNREQPEYVVRITADDPLKDPKLIDHAIQLILQDSNLNYVTNTLVPSFPEGLDVEVFSSDALLRADREATAQYQREHVTPFIWGNPQIFLRKDFFCSEDLSDWRWTLDTFDDWLFLDEVLKRLDLTKSHSHLDEFDYEVVVELLRTEPMIFKLMPKLERSMARIKRNQESDHHE